jgi:hypothetical protein
MSNSIISLVKCERCNNKIQWSFPLSPFEDLHPTFSVFDLEENVKAELVKKVNQNLYKLMVFCNQCGYVNKFTYLHK